MLTLVQLNWRTGVLAGGLVHVFRPKTRPKNHPQHNARAVIAAQVPGWCQGLGFLSWWQRCLFCASGIKGRHCWNEKQMLGRNSPDCSSFFHAWASNAASVHRSPPCFLSVSAVHTIPIFILLLFFPTLTHTKPELLLNLGTNLAEKACQIWGLTAFWRKEGNNEKESTVAATEVLFLNHGMGFKRDAWLWGLPRWQDPCLRQEASQLAALHKPLQMELHNRGFNARQPAVISSCCCTHALSSQYWLYAAWKSPISESQTFPQQQHLT